MSGLGLVTDYNDSEDVSENEDRSKHNNGDQEKEETDQPGPSQAINDKLMKISQSKDSSNSGRSGDRDETRGNQEQRSRNGKHRDSYRREGHRDDRKRDRSRDRSHGKPRDDVSNRRSDKRHHDRPRDSYRRDREHRGSRNSSSSARKHQAEKEKEYNDYRKRKYGDSRDWGKVSEESLKDVKTDATLPTSFDSTIAKQLAAQREKRKLLWSKKDTTSESEQKSVWGAGSLRNDESGEQTVKFLKLMGVKDVNADNVKDYKKSDESVIRSSQAVDSMETEYEKSRYLQHMSKGVGLGMVQFSTATQPPS